MKENKIKVGLLSLMLKLYDKSAPELKQKQTVFATKVIELLSSDMNIVFGGVANTKETVHNAIKKFESEKVDVILILFLSYAPSLIVIDSLKKTKIPVIIFDTTPKNYIDNTFSHNDMMENHAIHGVQDLTNMLIRSEKKFGIVAGHISDKTVIKKLIDMCYTVSEKETKQYRVGRIGNIFRGMGDFFVDKNIIKKFIGANIINIPINEYCLNYKNIDKNEIEKVYKIDKSKYVFDKDIDKNLIEISIRAELALRKIVSDYELSAISVNFLDIGNCPSAGTVPFYGISKLISEGYGYAGEGDTTCAVMVKFVSEIAGQSTFTEMFCPDWTNKEIFMSHMGESNLKMAYNENEIRVIKKSFPYGIVKSPLVFLFRYKPGTVTIANLTMVNNKKLRIICSCADITDFYLKNIDVPHFKIRPHLQLEKFLTYYSYAGGTHHLAMTYGDITDKLEEKSVQLGIDFIRI